MSHIVKIVEDSTGEAVKTFTADNERQAERLADGISINLDHSKFSVEVSEA